ncbi:MAG: DUF86 domain-containing protein [Chloroflexaceae bacterium]|nr:DUF86 domain-containing protein [Chloroflexaceae bacterium]
MSREVSFYLQDILNCIAKIERFTAEMDYASFESNEVVIDAVIRNLEIIGEAAKQLPPRIRQANSEIEWRQLARFRDFLAHGYFRIELEIIWNTVQAKLPTLRVQISALLAAIQSDGLNLSEEIND